MRACVRARCVGVWVGGVMHMGPRRFEVVYCGAVFHLLREPEQRRLADVVTTLLAPGGVFFGRHVCSVSFHLPPSLALLTLSRRAHHSVPGNDVHPFCLTRWPYTCDRTTWHLQSMLDCIWDACVCQAVEALYQSPRAPVFTRRRAPGRPRAAPPPPRHCRRHRALARFNTGERAGRASAV